MKKLLALGIAITTMSTTTLAGVEDIFFLKASVGGNLMNAATNKTTKLKIKAETIPFIEFGVGYYVMDNARVSLTFEHFFNPKLKKTNAAAGLEAMHKGKVDALLINGAIDLFDISVAKVFITLGAGATQVKEKITATIAGVTSTTNSKQKINIAGNGGMGFSTELTQGINAEVAYSFKYFGKTKAGTIYKGHNVALGFRFDL